MNKFKRSQFWQFKITDIFTLIMVIVGVVNLGKALSDDYALRLREQADDIRSAAAKALTNLETMQALQLSLFDELQPVYVDVSQKLYTRSLPTRENARDYCPSSEPFGHTGQKTNRHFGA